MDIRRRYNRKIINQTFFSLLKKRDIDKVTVSEEKALKWLNNGAIPTDTVRSILSKQGIMKKFALQKESGK